MKGMIVRRKRRIRRSRRRGRNYLTNTAQSWRIAKPVFDQTTPRAPGPTYEVDDISGRIRTGTK